MSNKKQINIFIGIPGSGKSYYAHQYHHNDIYINADSLREQLTGDINNQEKNHFVFQHLEIMVEYFMRQGVSICIDNCNQMISRRKNWLSLGKKYGYKIYAVCFKTSLEECKKL